MENQEIKILSMGCRLNALEAEKIRAMLAAAGFGPAVVVNTCSVTNEAQRQSRQAFRKIVRENPGVPVFATGCGATHRPDDFAGAVVIPNDRKFDISAYSPSLAKGCLAPKAQDGVVASFSKMQKKGFVQIGDGCDRACSYCITRILRGRAVCFPYEQILADARALIENGYEEIILTGVNIADFSIHNSQCTIHNLGLLCRKLLNDLPNMKHLTLSSLDPAADIESIIDLIAAEPRMTRHLHLSVQSGSDEILRRMARRHTRERIKGIADYAKCLLGGAGFDKTRLAAEGRNYWPLRDQGDFYQKSLHRTESAITFSWDIICGFPGETEALFAETLALARELRPIKIHAFPFSARPGTAAASMPDQVPRAVSKERVRELVRACGQ